MRSSFTWRFRCYNNLIVPRYSLASVPGRSVSACQSVSLSVPANSPSVSLAVSMTPCQSVKSVNRCVGRFIVILSVASLVSVSPHLRDRFVLSRLHKRRSKNSCICNDTLNINDNAHKKERDRKTCNLVFET